MSLLNWLILVKLFKSVSASLMNPYILGINSGLVSLLNGLSFGFKNDAPIETYSYKLESKERTFSIDYGFIKTILEEPGMFEKFEKCFLGVLKEIKHYSPKFKVEYIENSSILTIDTSGLYTALKINAYENFTQSNEYTFDSFFDREPGFLYLEKEFEYFSLQIEATGDLINGELLITDLLNASANLFIDFFQNIKSALSSSSIEFKNTIIDKSILLLETKHALFLRHMIKTISEFDNNEVSYPNNTFALSFVSESFKTDKDFLRDFESIISNLTKNKLFDKYVDYSYLEIINVLSDDQKKLLASAFGQQGFYFRLVSANPSNMQSNEVLFRHEISEYSPEILMMFFKYGNSPSEEDEYLIIYKANEPCLVPLEDFFKTLKNAKAFGRYICKGLEYYHERKITGVRIFSEVHFLFTKEYPCNKEKFDLTLAKISDDDSFEADKKKDYSLFLNYFGFVFGNIENMNDGHSVISFISKFYDSDNDINELHSFLKD